MAIRPYVRVGLIAVFALLMGSCSDYKDALVVNPCRQAVEVRFGGDKGKSVSDPVWTQRSPVEIPPLTSQLVRSAFADVGPEQYVVLVEVADERTLISVADVGETILVPIPESVCA